MLLITIAEFFVIQLYSRPFHILEFNTVLESSSILFTFSKTFEYKCTRNLTNRGTIFFITNTQLLLLQ